MDSPSTSINQWTLSSSLRKALPFRSNPVILTVRWQRHSNSFAFSTVDGFCLRVETCFCNPTLIKSFSNLSNVTCMINILRLLNGQPFHQPCYTSGHGPHIGFHFH